MRRLVLLRHGESAWNRENRFTGWTDVDLTEKGVAEARQAGLLLREEGFAFDITYTSVLVRATRTLSIVLDEMGLHQVPVEKSWRLNERHYGALQGLNKSETARKFGENQVRIWRRSYDIPPPALSADDPHHPSHDPLYGDIDPAQLPSSESLRDTAARVLPYWNTEIAPAVTSGRRVLIAAHGNSLRALVMHLDRMTGDQVAGLNIPTAVPLVYELDDDLVALRHYYLGNADAIGAAMKAVADQGRAE